MLAFDKGGNDPCSAGVVEDVRSGSDGKGGKDRVRECEFGNGAGGVAGHFVVIVAVSAVKA